MSTPTEEANKAGKNVLGAKKTQEKTITLPSGKIAVCVPAKGKHVYEAQRLMEGNADRMMFALITVVTTIDGKRLTIEELDEMSAGDVMTLMGENADAFQ